MTGKKTHGAARTPPYRAWTAMLNRCRNPSNPAYAYYGGRGIKVCERWLDYASFLEDMGPRPAGMTLERLDNERGYEPENCCWATRKEQTRNNRRNHYLTAGGERMLLTDWARRLGISAAALHKRIQRGWSEERVCLTPPVRHVKESYCGV